MSQSEEKLVYVGFAADIVHHGHINILNVASSLGRVVVGLLTDEAIASYKRNTIIKWENRKTVVENLQGVSEVIPQATLDYAPNLVRLRPDYVVHGTDWRNGPQALARQKVIDTLAQWGGQLVEPEYTQNVSTTEIISKCSEWEKKRRDGQVPSTSLEVAQTPHEELVEMIKPLESHRPIAYVTIATDFIHHGHMHVINKAKELGTVVLGLLTDEAIASYKDKPAVAFNDRMVLFKHIKGVHAVIPQHELSYKPNLSLLKPEFVVHGDNWRSDNQAPVRSAVVEQLKEWGGQLVEPNYTVVDMDESATEERKEPPVNVSSITDLITETCLERVLEKEAKLKAGLVSDKPVPVPVETPVQPNQAQ